MEYSLKDIKCCLIKITDKMISLKEELTDIDSKLGDGDMGISMEKGALALKGAMEGIPDDTDIKVFFMKCASAFNRAAPSTMGTLLSGGMIQVGKKFEGKTVLKEEEAVMIPLIMAEAIAVRGKANVGDKTILDALVPFAETLTNEYGKTDDLQKALHAAVVRAHDGVEMTKGIIAKTGRAKWLSDRNKEFPDGGAYMCYEIAKVFLSDF